MAQLHRARHTISVDAPADAAFTVVEDVASWPWVFPPTVHVERRPVDAHEEVIHIWATANGEVRDWTSRRRIDRAAGTIGFRQEVTRHPAASMGGRWTVVPRPGGGCDVVLDHEFTAVDDDPGHVAWIQTAMDRNSDAELAAVKTTAERAARTADLLLRFEDTVLVNGSVDDVYAFVWRADEWEWRLPHVARITLGDLGPDLQRLEMDTRAKDGSVHTTESIRVGFGPHRVVYKQLRPPALLTAHTGEWTFAPGPAGTTATSRHTVVIDPDAVPTVLGPQATVADAREMVRAALGTNSLATLRLAKDYAERRTTVGM